MAGILDSFERGDADGCAPRNPRPFDRDAGRLVIALAVAAYGLYTLALLPGMLVAPPVSLLVVGFVLQVAFAFAGAIGIWLRRPWAPLVVVFLGVAIAATAITEAMMGITAFMSAVLTAVLSVVLALLVAGYLCSAPAARRGLDRRSEAPTN